MALIQPLSSKPLAVIGDVHGERSMLRALLEKLGVAPSFFEDSGTDMPSLDYHLVFVGDLVDRGPDSPGVLKDVLKLMDAGLASCVLGNHEYNMLCDRDKKRSGTAWQRGETEADATWTQALLTEEDAKRFEVRLDQFPLILERSDLRIVHAAWHEDAVAQIRSEASNHTIKTYSALMKAVLAPKLAELQRQVDVELPDRSVLNEEGDKPPYTPEQIPSYIAKSIWSRMKIRSNRLRRVSKQRRRRSSTWITSGAIWTA